MKTRTLLLTLALMWAWCAPAWASWAHVQSVGLAESSSASTIALAYGSNVTAGSGLVATIGWHCASAETISGVADSQTQTWTQAGTTRTVASLGGDWCIAVFYFANSAAGANTVTATISGSVDERTIAVHEYSGLATSSMLDQTTGQGQVDPGTGTDAVTSTAVTTTAANELIFGATLAIGDLDTVAAGTNFTGRVSPDGTFSSLYSEDRNLAGAGSVAATFTSDSATGDHATIVATFKEPAAAGGGGDCGRMLGVFRC